MSLAAVLQHVQVLEASGLVRSHKSRPDKDLRHQPGRPCARPSPGSPSGARCGSGAWTCSATTCPARAGRRTPPPSAAARLARAPRPAIHQRRTGDCAFCHPRHLHDRAHLPGSTVARCSKRRSPGRGQEHLGATTGGLRTRRTARPASPSSTSGAGGRERFGVPTMDSTTYRYDARLLRHRAGPADHLPPTRCHGDARISVSLATIEFETENGDGTALTVTEQGAYLDGIDGPRAPALRNEGVARDARQPHRVPGLPDRSVWRQSLPAPQRQGHAGERAGANPVAVKWPVASSAQPRDPPARGRARPGPHEAPRR